MCLCVNCKDDQQPLISLVIPVTLICITSRCRRGGGGGGGGGAGGAGGAGQGI